MSGNQVAMAKEWHGSSTDVYLILRVYDFRSSPNVFAYVDPHALRLAGRLSFTAQGSYSVQPA
ncbi:hypothetical protein LTR08_008178 [Meristemomyces frigidus]|nr:hypothetical protein LTR08_008178 [Meristemomyces frigidus]